MACAAANVEHAAHAIELPPLRHEIEEVGVPPEVTLWTEVIGGVRFIAHRARNPSYYLDTEEWNVDS